jgi:hypothetical protein
MKKLHEELNDFAKHNFDYIIEKAVQKSVLLAIYYNQLEALEKAASANFYVSDSGISFDAESQEEVKTFRQIFGLPGQVWSRTPHYSGEGIVYSIELPHPAPYYDGETMQIQVSTKELPPSCTIVYEEVEEPAKIVKRAKVVCKTSEKNEDDENVTSA